MAKDENKTSANYHYMNNDNQTVKEKTLLQSEIKDDLVIIKINKSYENNGTVYSYESVKL